MLSDNTIAIVKATVPVLQEGGEALTRHFYKRMFTHNPEVLSLFNPANQAEGTQQKALANAICAYAMHIDNLDALGGAVELIAHKHASLRIQPEQYPIVGENLLASIKEVLGDAATDDILKAWGEAYEFLADVLINREGQIYADQEKAPGGWKDFKNFKVVRKERESNVITSFYLKPEDGSPPPEFNPGQYITVRVPSPCGHTTMRNYSLSDEPGQDALRISVKREDKMDHSPAGYVSNMLHNNTEVGQVLEIGPPCGEFFLKTTQGHTKPLVLLAAGVGITPLLSILLAALKTMPDRDIIFIQASVHENNQAFKKTIETLAAQHPNLKRHYRYSDPVPEGLTREQSKTTSEGLVDISLIKSMVGTPDADYYFCGPKSFMVNVYHDLLQWGTPPSQMHFEFFGPRQEIENPKTQTNRIA